MRNILNVFTFEFRRQFTRRGFLFATFGLPLIALVLFFAIREIVTTNAANSASNQETQSESVGGSGRSAPPGVNIPGLELGDDSPFRNILPSGYVDLSGLLEQPIPGWLKYSSTAEAEAALKNGAIGGYYVIHADYLDTGKIDFYFERLNFGTVDNSPMRRALLEALTARGGADLSPQVLRLLQSRELSIDTTVVGSTAQVTEGSAFLLAYIFSFLLLFTAFTTSGYLMQSVVEEKENRTVEILLSSLRPRELLMGKFLTMSLLGLTQMLVWFGAAMVVFTYVADLSPVLSALRILPEQWVVLGLYFLLGYAFFGAAYAAIGALINNMREGAQFSALVIIPAMIPFYLIPIFASTPNAALPTIMSILPITSPMAMVLRVSVTPVPFLEVFISAVLLILAILFVVWLAGRFFRVNVLLAGNAPRFRDLLRIVREKA
ncbi:MAG: ABC transporter permease [Anaerolineae bacterium]